MSSLIQTPLQRSDDLELVAAFRAGREAAFTDLHGRYREPLIAFARRMLHGSGHDPEDVVQDAFVRAHGALRATGRPMALRPWLYMIIRNRALDGLRARRTQLPLQEATWRARPTRRATRQRDELDRIVAELAPHPERQRLALVQRAFAAPPTPISPTSSARRSRPLKSLIIRARTQLRAVQAA